MSIPRFYIPPDEFDLAGIAEFDRSSGKAFSTHLSPLESQHASVLRLKSGDSVELFDGAGHIAKAEIASCSKRSTEVIVGDCKFLPNELPGKVRVITCLPKSDRQKALIEKIVELGVHELIVVSSERSIVRPNEKSIDRLTRYAVESCKQCGRNRAPKIKSFSSLQKLLQGFASTSEDEASPAETVDGIAKASISFRWLAHPYLGEQRNGQIKARKDDANKDDAPAGIEERPSISLTQKPVDEVRAASFEIMVGPEGGFTDSEVEMILQHDWQRLQLGPRILRVETAISRSVSIASEILEPSRVYQ